MRITKYSLDLSTPREKFLIVNQGNSIVVEYCNGEVFAQLDSEDNGLIPLHNIGGIYNANFEKIYITNREQIGKRIDFYVCSDAHMSRNTLTLREILEALNEQKSHVETLTASEIISNLISANTILGEMITAGTIRDSEEITRMSLDRGLIEIYDSDTASFSLSFSAPYSYSEFAERWRTLVEGATREAIIRIGKGALPSGKDGIYVKNANIYIDGGLLADQIASYAITGDKIAAKSIDASKLNVDTLSAISANLGTITAGILRGASSTAEFNLNTEQLTVANGKIKIGKGVLPNGSDGIYIDNANLYINGGILSDHIATGAVTTNKLAAGAVTADKIQVSSLSAISANLGTITAGILRGSTSTAEFNLNSEQLIVANGKIKIGKGVLPNGGDGIYIDNANLHINGGLLGNHIAAGAITANHIAAGTITGDKIAANTITADKLNVSQLSAISANLGTITAGTLNAVTVNSSTINGGTVNTPLFILTASQGKIVYQTSGWEVYDCGSSSSGCITHIKYHGSDNRSCFSISSTADTASIYILKSFSGAFSSTSIACVANEARFDFTIRSTDSYWYYPAIVVKALLGGCGIIFNADGIAIPVKSTNTAPGNLPAGFMFYWTGANRLWIWTGSQWAYVNFTPV